MSRDKARVIRSTEPASAEVYFDSSQRPTRRFEITIHNTAAVRRMIERNGK